MLLRLTALLVMASVMTGYGQSSPVSRRLEGQPNA